MIVMEKRNLLLSEMQIMQTGGEGLTLILSVDKSGTSLMDVVVPDGVELVIREIAMSIFFVFFDGRLTDV